MVKKLRVVFKLIVVFNIFQWNPKRLISYCVFTISIWSDSRKIIEYIDGFEDGKEKNVQPNFTFCHFICFF